MKRHIHKWRELLQRGHGDRTTFVVCDQCEAENRNSMRYLDKLATAEFRRQIKHKISPRFDHNKLIAYDWSKS